MLTVGDSALRKEADAMTFVGCDLHTRTQQVAVLDTGTGEVSEHQLVHEGRAVEEFYAALPRPATVGIERTGYAVWFHTLVQRLGHTLLVGEAAKIRAMVVRKTKTDRRDARHILDLLRHDRFPTIWVPDPATRDLRALLMHRMRLVRIRTMVKNGLHAIALNYRLARGSKLRRQAGLAQLQTIALPPLTRRSAAITASSCSSGSTRRSASWTTRSRRRPWPTPTPHA
jgi:transposase